MLASITQPLKDNNLGLCTDCPVNSIKIIKITQIIKNITV